MAFLEIMDQVVAHAIAIEQERATLQKEHGIRLGITVGDPKHSAYLSQVRQIYGDLSRYLNSLTSQDVFKLETVMYFGRDTEDIHGNDIAEYNKQLHSADADKEDSIRNILEKTSCLETYFEDARRKASTLSVDLNSVI